MLQTEYRGRFAPSPSGHLHFGSLLAATASYLQARKMNGQWWLRIEDIDPPREKEGSSDYIIKTLSQYGFEWDHLSYQSQKLDIYSHYINTLLSNGQAYYCGCTRKEIYQRNKAESTLTTIYPGTCREGLNGKSPRAIRVKVSQPLVSISDAIQGAHTLDIGKIAGDFIIKRADGFFSYQLAVAIDDSKQEMTQVVRGYDLYPSSFSQKYLCQLLQLKSPDYAHIPVANSPEGIKLSKKSAAKDIATQAENHVLWQILSCLGQQPHKQLKSASLKKIWQWGIENWDISKVPQLHSINSPNISNI